MWYYNTMELPIDDAVVEDGGVHCCRQYCRSKTGASVPADCFEIRRTNCQSWISTGCDKYRSWNWFGDWSGYRRSSTYP